MTGPRAGPDPVRVEAMAPGDWEDVRRIYAEGIATGNATLETESPSREAWDGAHRPDCRLVARAGSEVIG
jgi:L-amino acid N-acyltransferase YncA